MEESTENFNGVFDAEMPYPDWPRFLASNDWRDRRFEVCTVRQRKLEDLPLGDLFWLLKAAQARTAGANVVVTDFYDKVGTPHASVLELMEILGLEEEDGVTFRRAEDVPRNNDFWRKFCDYVREHREDQETWETIGTVRDGVQAVLDNDGYDVPESMQRFLEELSVWVEAIDEDAVQVLHHELENTRWVRRLYPGAKKKFVGVHLPFKNEYRGKYREDGVDEERVIHQRRIQDLFAKLTQAPEAFTNDEDPEFYRHLFDELIAVLESRCFEYEDANYYVQKDLLKLDPKLVAIYLKARPNQAVQAFIRDSDMIKEYIHGIVEVHQLNRRTIGARLMELRRFIESGSGRKFEGILDNKKMEELLMADDIDLEELMDFLIYLTEDEAMKKHPKLFGHPAVDRIAREVENADPRWVIFKNCLVKYLKGDLSSARDFSTPIFNRLFEELKSDPDQCHSIANAQNETSHQDYRYDFFVRDKRIKARERLMKRMERMTGLSLETKVIEEE